MNERIEFAKELTKLVEEFIDSSLTDSDEDQALKGILLKSVSLLNSSLFLCKDPNSATACLILSRSMLESSIVIKRYIHKNQLSSGLKRFRDFEVASLKEDLEYLRSHDVDPSGIDTRHIDDLFLKNKKLFEYKADEIRRSWYPPVEEMLKELSSSDETGSILFAYLLGNRGTHLNFSHVRRAYLGLGVAWPIDNDGLTNAALGTSISALIFLAADVAAHKKNEDFQKKFREAFDKYLVILRATKKGSAAPAAEAPKDLAV